jgi:hypothetical protein
VDDQVESQLKPVEILIELLFVLLIVRENYLIVDASIPHGYKAQD